MRTEITSRNYNAGEHIVSITNASRKFSNALVRFLRESWPAGIIEVFIERSLDGQKWEIIASATFEGGDPIKPDTGLPFTHSELGVFTTERDGDIRIRAVTSARIRTTLSVDTL